MKKTEEQKQLTLYFKKQKKEYKRGNAMVVIKATKRFNQIIDRVESRCLATDGPVTPTLKEMREDELRQLWLCLKTIQSRISPDANT